MAFPLLSMMLPGIIRLVEYPFAKAAPRLPICFLRTTASYFAKQIVKNVRALLIFSNCMKMLLAKRLMQTNHPSFSAAIPLMKEEGKC